MQYGDRMLIRPVSFAISSGERIGLIGKNGAGKSTLLKILSGEITPHEGQLAFPKDFEVGYLQQELPAGSGRSLMEEVRTGLGDTVGIERHFRKLQKEMETREDYSSDSYMELIEDFTRAQEKMNNLNAAHLEKKIELILKGLGFKRSEFNMPVESFSGGWRMRIELAKLLLQMPDLLLLDEPTNHLDIHSIIWLEEFLSKYPGSIMLVSHDTTFMNKLCNRIIEIEFGHLHDYKSTYNKFLELKKDRLEKNLAAYENQQREVAQIKRNIERFRYKASKAKFAQTLIKKLEKTEMIEIETTDDSAMKFSFPEGHRGGKVVVKLEEVSKSFGEKQVLKDVNLELERGEKVAFVGKNGMGKTTLARIIAGDLQESGGQVEHGYNIELNYFAQLQPGTLDGDMTVFETIDKEATGDMRTKVRSLLGAFLFSGEDADKKVKVLSGGEKSRLALARMLLEPSNFLLLDEPTNHLDVSSKAILKQAVQQFEGAAIIVSHDRDFLDGLTDRIIEFTEDGLNEYLGDINYFLAQNQFGSIRDFELEKDDSNSGSKTSKPKPANDYKLRKERAKEERRLQNAVKRLEKKIDEKEAAKQPLVEALQSNYDEAKATEFHHIEQAIEKLTAEWMEAQEKLEEFLNEDN